VGSSGGALIGLQFVVITLIANRRNLASAPWTSLGILSIVLGMCGVGGLAYSAVVVRRAHVVSAFGTVPSEVLFGVFAAKRKAKRPSLVHCGDDQSAKDVAATLIRDVGFDPVDAGPLRIARYMEPFSLLVGRLA
jgi:hypothetical protein